MTCNEVRALIPLLPSDDLSEGEKSGLLDHVETCPACRQQVEEYKKSHRIIRSVTSGLCGSDHPPKAPEDFLRSVSRAIRLDQEGRRFSRWSLWLPGLGRVAALLVLAMGTGMFVRGLNDHRLTRQPLPLGRFAVVTINPLSGQLVPLKNWRIEQNESGIYQVVLFAPIDGSVGQNTVPHSGNRLTDDDIEQGIEHINKTELIRSAPPKTRYEPVADPGYF